MPRFLFIFIVFLCLFIFPNYSNAQQSDTNYVVTNIRIVGNNKTKDYVLIRELTFALGDTILSSQLIDKLAKSRNNIYNTSLFNFVTVTHHPVIDNFTEILIVVTERWYIWPYPIIEVADPNFNTWWETKDLHRINFGATIMDRNFRGKKEKLGFILQLGYSKKFGVFYDVPFTEKHQKIGYGAYASYFQNYEVIYGTENNKRLFTRPSGTSKEEWYNAVYLNYRNKIFVSHRLIGFFQDIMVEDSIVYHNPNFFGNSETRMQTLGLRYVIKNDHRDNKSYPLKGYFMKGILEHYGFGLLSDKAFTKATVEIKTFSSFSKNFYWAVSGKAKFSLQKTQPYYFQNMLGYADYVRGYEYYVIDGRYAALFKSNLKYKLISSSKNKLPLVKNPTVANFHYAVYVNAFADAGYVGKPIFSNNNLAETTLFGYGIGLDFVTYYDKVVRFEFSRNKRNELGFFLHFVQPI